MPQAKIVLYADAVPIATLTQDGQGEVWVTIGGIYKRIDENRELLEMLQREAPALLCQRPWIVGWIQSQDMFLSELASAAEVDDPMIKPQAGFPRSWPVSIVTTHE